MRFLVFLVAAAVAGEEWSRFRGPNGTGVSAAKGVPVEFGAAKNVIWKAPVRSGKSSPVLSETRVFLTGFENGKLYTQAFDRATGKLVWEQAVDKKHDQITNRLNHPAAITPATDGESVFSFFKDFGMVAYDGGGKEKWRAPLGPFTSSMGIGASPVVNGDSVILLIEGYEDSHIAAYDRRNGELRWKILREEHESWTTPVAYQSFLVTVSRGILGVHNARDGKRLWGQDGLSPAIVSSPTIDGDTVYSFGYGNAEPIPWATAQKRYDKDMDGKITGPEYGPDPFYNGVALYKGNRDGVITQEEWDNKQRELVAPSSLVAHRLERQGGKVRSRLLWRVEKNFAHIVPAVLSYEGVVYVVRNGGILQSFDGATGKLLKEARIPGALGGYSASPVAAGGRLYLASEEGKVSVLKAGGDWEVLSVNEVGEGIYGTPALAAGRIFVRTSDTLYCFGGPPAP